MQRILFASLLLILCVSPLWSEQLDRYDRLSEEMELLKQRCDGVLAAERLEFDRQLNEIKNLIR